MKKILYPLLWIISLSSLGQRVQDSLVLVALYNSTNCANWHFNTNWLSSEPISTWDGITLTDNRVSSIHLKYYQLSGSIPKEIGNLTNLEYLVLGDNQLIGSIPPEIGNLTNLLTLDLSGNQLTGSIPPEIGNLTNLAALILAQNQLTGHIPKEIGNLTNLTWLILSQNQLTGFIPTKIKLNHLGMYSFSHNKFIWAFFRKKDKNRQR
jgi:Leucine-rich repeat (LRR) protein